eukprot:CAMPEP_0201698534 /NCGR_PEP_ID=MMETSP0578-20130828/19688_1 /ASSEMBLY_ACC=CAM_ASM_000663 /TAXON_ID=267565 /ORGANISM="Skeletonema grethea, Strain CCMP 1804" /LENGTH=233 /DNA_ID=CAMNT_0048185101 /DNA_START=40 /DNA_END=741 /DNA_ORIENTATION=-
MQLRRISTAFIGSAHHRGSASVGCHQLASRMSNLMPAAAVRMANSNALDVTETNNNGNKIEICVPTPDDMEDIGGILSVGSTGGDVILLDGDLGAGKTCFSRGFIRGRTGRYDERVTSPTYLLSNSYDVDGGSTKLYHMDLYRLSGSENDLLPLNLDNVFTSGISLIEWPSRLNKKPSERLEITLTIDSSTDATPEIEDEDSKYRRMTLVPFGARWAERLKFLQSEGLLEDLM